MQYDENAYKYGYEGEMTPMKCDELKAYKGDVTIPVYGTIADAQVYIKKYVDVAIAELKDAWRSEHEACEALKAKLENVQASMYCDVVDANMDNSRLKHALWLARAERASDKARIFYFAETCGVELNIDGYSNKEKVHTRMRSARWWRLTWLKVERKCRAKAEEY